MKTTTLTFATLASLLAFSPAYADDTTPGAFSYAWKDSRVATGIGVTATVGGGVADFTDEGMRDQTDVGGLWNFQATVGSRIPVGLELGYAGTAANINALVGSQSGTLVGTTFEAAARVNLLPHAMFNPYVLAGVGYQRYDVTSADFTLSATGMNDSDQLAVFPLGAGVAYHDKTGFIADLRGTIRVATDSELVLENASSSSFHPAHTWGINAGIGYEF